MFNINMAHTPIKILKVKPLKDVRKLPRPIPSYLPQMKGEVILLTAPICQGKSNFIVNWFLNPELANGLFDTIYLISNTARQDDTSRFLIDEPNVVVYDSYNDSIIENIIETQKQYEKKDMPRIAIVFDDILGSMKLNSKGFQIASRARHYNIANLFYVIQKFNYVPPCVRCNITHLLAFAGNYNEKELKSIDEEYGSAGGEIGFYKLYKDHIQNNKYNFLYCNLQTGNVYRNFDTLLHSNFERIDDTNTNDKNDENDETDETENKMDKL